MIDLLCKMMTLIRERMCAGDCVKEVSEGLYVCFSSLK